MVAPTKKIIFIVGEAFRLPLLCAIIVYFREEAIKLRFAQ